VSLLRAELFHDDEAGNWHHRVATLHTDGSGAATREEAERDRLAAIALAPQGDPRDYDTDAEILTLNVRAAPASAPGCS
jgi:hypothetical protein